MQTCECEVPRLTAASTATPSCPYALRHPPMEGNPGILRPVRIVTVFSWRTPALEFLHIVWTKREMTHREKLVWMAKQKSPGEARHFSQLRKGTSSAVHK